MAADGENGIEEVFRKEGGIFEDVLPGGLVASVHHHGVGEIAGDAGLCVRETVFQIFWKPLDDAFRPDVCGHGGSPAFAGFLMPADFSCDDAAVAGEKNLWDEPPRAVSSQKCPEFKIFTNTEIDALAACGLGDIRADERGACADMIVFCPEIIEIVQKDRLLDGGRVRNDVRLVVERLMALHDADGDSFRMAAHECRRFVEEFRLPEIVAVQKSAIFALGLLKAAIAGGGGALVVFLLQDFDGWTAKFFNDRQGIVRGAVIDHDDFSVMSAILPDDGTNGSFNKEPEIIGWDDDADGRHV